MLEAHSQRIQSFDGFPYAREDEIKSTVWRSVQAQIAQELEFRSRLQPGEESVFVSETEALYVNFNLDSQLQRITDMFASEMVLQQIQQHGHIELLDIGCGLGKGANRSKKFLSKAGVPSEALRITATSLIDFTGQVPAGVDDYRIGVAAEFLPADFDKRFHFIKSINGPTAWSKYPELCLNNLINSLAPGGILMTNSISEHAPNYADFTHMLQDCPVRYEKTHNSSRGMPKTSELYVIQKKSPGVRAVDIEDMLPYAIVF